MFLSNDMCRLWADKERFWCVSFLCSGRLNLIRDSWDKVHAEADKLEHVISEEFEDKVDALLGYPTVDPHGDPIPSKDGIIAVRKGCTLTQLKDGQAALILRINDQNPEKLCYLGQLGLYPETSVQMLGRAPFSGPIRILVGEKPHQIEHMLGVELAEQIIVTSTEAQEVAHE